jgi:hypothetical protein
MPLYLPSRAPKNTAPHNPARIQIRSIRDTRKTSGSGVSELGRSSPSWSLRGDDSSGLDSEGVETLGGIDGAQLWGEVGQNYRMGKGKGISTCRETLTSASETPVFR